MIPRAGRHKTKSSRTKAVLVTLADARYLEQAKQLFASARFNGVWKGDYCLLARDIPEDELAWFRDAGIFIRECTSLPLVKENLRDDDAWFSKFHLLSTYFKRWDRVVYLDSDIMVRHPLDMMLKRQGMCAVPEPYDNSLRYQFIPRIILPASYRARFERLQKEYDLDAPGYNSGVMTFTTDVITETSVQQLVDLCNRFRPLGFSDQPYFNLLFHGRIHALGPEYNVYVPLLMKYGDVHPDAIDGVILHFMGGWKPWKGGPFQKEWQANLDKMADVSGPLRRVPRETAVGPELSSRVHTCGTVGKSRYNRYSYFCEITYVLQYTHPRVFGFCRTLYYALFRRRQPT